VFFKKGAGKKPQTQEADREDGSARWREDKKTAAVKMNKTQITTPKAIKRRLKIGETIGVGEMAKKMGVKAGEVISKLMANGMMVTINQSIDFDVATLIASEFGYQIEAADMELEEAMMKPAMEAKNLQTRAPIVTIMGHVDHGKTSLLDAIRSTNVIDGEAGGITQAIGAYRVHINGRDIVFLDTPGHEAFTAMRARGAKVTDVVVLVVAADDGIMDQTVEAIHHSRVAEVPILVAINKMDKPSADPGKIKQSLTEHGLVSEEWGGETIFCEVSAKKKEGIEELLEMILLQADILDLKADPDLPARGIIVEAKLDRGRGPVATVLIQEGTLHEGDAFVSKMEWGRVRVMYNDQGARVREAGPSTPVEVIGFSSVPYASSEFVGMDDEKKARSIAEYWIRKGREKELSSTSKITLEQLYQKIREGAKDLNVIVKADVQGAIEALSDALNKLSTDDIKLNIIHSSSGTITETDVMLASASNAIIIGFNVRPDSRVSELAEQEGVEIKLYDIIYNAIADVRAAMEGLLDPEYRDVVQGRAEVRELFRVPKVGTIAGSFVTEGKIIRKSSVRLVRDGIQIFDGRIMSLKRFKEDAKEVLSGFECGIGIDGFNDLRQGDVIEAYAQEKIERKL
ncbi:MAG: translation initiation factor IF-2, partial [Syntrophobacterales bacterium]|jgi:translation initiation factor IF-2|nr:translation initiation factor IF-2 [Syntrophobacterales bacterium]